MAVDSLGLILCVIVHSAGLQDDTRRAVGALFVRMAFQNWRRLWKIYADQMYEGQAVLWARAVGGWLLHIVRRTPGIKGFQRLPKRWIVERTFAWLGRYRRLSKDYEYLPNSSETMIHIAMINLMLHRLEPG